MEFQGFQTILTGYPRICSLPESLVATVDISPAHPLTIDIYPVPVFGCSSPHHLATWPGEGLFRHHFK